MNERRVITAGEAQTYLGIPAGTIRGWASAGRLFPCSIGPDRQRWYVLSEVLALVETTKRRESHTRPARCLLTSGSGHIA